MTEGPVAHPVKDAREKPMSCATPRSESKSSCTEEEEREEHEARVAELEREAEKDEIEEAFREEVPSTESADESNGDGDAQSAESADERKSDPMYLTIRIRTVRTINTTLQNFFASFDLFALWKDPEAERTGEIVREKEKGLHRPHIALPNALVDQWDLRYDGPVHPIRHKNGDWYYLWHGTYQGVFSTPFYLQTFPFDYQQLRIQVLLLVQ